jgi:hypothetical protein
MCPDFSFNCVTSKCFLQKFSKNFVDTPDALGLSFLRFLEYLIAHASYRQSYRR